MNQKEKAEKMRPLYIGLYDRSGIYLTDNEKESFDIGDFFIDELDTIGTACLTYFNTKSCCARELAMFLWQTIPEHRHPPVGDYPGKEETFRCRWGTVYLYITGEPAEKIQGRIPEGRESAFTVFHEIILRQGEQFSLPPDTLHWFQGGSEGCVVSEFSTPALDGYDIYTDEEIMSNRRKIGFQADGR